MPGNTRLKRRKTGTLRVEHISQTLAAKAASKPVPPTPDTQPDPGASATPNQGPAQSALSLTKEH